MQYNTMLRNKLYVYGDERLEVPSHLHFGKDLLDRMVEYGDHPALINAEDGQTVTFGQLAQKSVDIALSLALIGVGKGDVVSICSEKRMEVIPTVLGVFCVGGVYSPVDITYGAVPLLHRVKIAQPKVMFMSPNAYDLHKPMFDSVGCIETYVVYGDENKDGCVLFKEFVTETADVADFVPTPVDGWKDLTLIQFSSGTTGLPKGVPWTHLAFLIGTECSTNESYKFSSMLITREWYYSYGLSITLSCLKRGTTCVFTINEGEEDFLRAIENYKVRIVQVAPSFINQLIKSTTLDRFDVMSVEAMMSGSSPLMREQIEAIKRRFPSLRDVYQLYGMVEAGSVCNDLYAPPKDGSVGTASHGFIIKVVDIKTRAPVGPNQRGEICIKSPSLTSGFIGVGNTDHLDSEGFYKTGDVGYYDDDRYFYVVNRIKELIKYKDTSIAPAELEAILEREPRVRGAGVAARGLLVAALVTLQPHARATPNDLLDYLHSNITIRMRLEGGVHIVDSLPRGAGDKLDRRALQKMLDDILDGETATNAQQLMQKRAVRAIVRVPEDTSALPLFRSLKILTLPSLAILQAALYGRDHLNEYSFLGDQRDRSARLGRVLRVPPHRLVKSYKLVHVMAAGVYNRLPDDIKDAPSRNSFKIRAKKWLVEQAFYKVNDFLPRVE